MVTMQTQKRELPAKNNIITIIIIVLVLFGILLAIYALQQDNSAINTTPEEIIKNNDSQDSTNTTDTKDVEEVSPEPATEDVIEEKVPDPEVDDRGGFTPF